MYIIRYDGTRFITEEEIDKELYRTLGTHLLIGTDNPWDGGHLVASSEGIDELRPALSSIAILELDSNAKIKY